MVCFLGWAFSADCLMNSPLSSSSFQHIMFCVKSITPVENLPTDIDVWRRRAKVEVLRTDVLDGREGKGAALCFKQLS